MRVFNPLLLFSACALALQTPPSQAIAAAQEELRIPDQEPDLTELSLNDLIERLPTLENEFWFEADDLRVHPTSLEMDRRLINGVTLSDAQWKRAFDVTGAFRLRSRWPDGNLIPAFMAVPGWLRLSQIRADCPINPFKTLFAGSLELPPMRCGNGYISPREVAQYQVFANLPRGKHTLEFDFVIERGKSTNDYGHVHYWPPWDQERTECPPEPGVLWSGRLAYDIEIVESIADAIPGVSNEQLDQTIRAGVRVESHERKVNFKSQPYTFLAVDLCTTDDSQLHSTGISLSIGVLRDGIEQARPSMQVTRDRVRTSRNSKCSGSEFVLYDGVSTLGIPSRVLEDAEELDRWSLSITGTTEGLLKMWDAETHWNGTLEIPLAEAVKRGRVWEEAEARRRARLDLGLPR